MSDTPTTPEEASNKAAQKPPRTHPPTHPSRSSDPLVPPVQLTPEQTQIKNALVRGCSATDADLVWVDTAQVLKVIDLATCEAANLFNYTVETTETITQKRRPNSIIPQSALTRSKGLSEVNRELLLQLLSR